ncbi:MAG: hypothetical protein WC527_03860 [Candidatus Margulisiibacteriota bacterium]
MKKLIAFLLAFLFLASVSLAQTPSIYSTANFSNGVSLGFLNTGTASTGLASWNPGFGLGAFKLGLGINIPFNDPTGRVVDKVVVRYVQYDSQKWGFRYGVIENYTLGYGLLVNNYTSAQTGIFESNQQTGLRAYYNQDIYGAEGMGTWSKFQAFRITEEIMPRLTLGQYYAGDSDGVDFVRPDGTRVVYPSQSGFGLDAGYSVWRGGVLFAEAAHMNNHGSGFSAGFNQDMDIFIGKANFRAERRFIDRNFVPEYFNENYETDPIDIVSFEAISSNKNGYKVQLGATVLSLGNIWAVLEGYEGSNTTLKGYASAKLSNQYFVEAGYFQQNFVDARSLDLSQGAVITGRLGYKVNPFTTVIANYKQYYDPAAGKVVYSQWYEMSLSL